MIARRFWLPVQAPALRRHSTHPLPAPFSFSRNCCAGSIHGSRSRPWARRRAPSQWRVCCSVIRRTFMLNHCPTPVLARCLSILRWALSPDCLGVAYNRALLGTLAACGAASSMAGGTACRARRHGSRDAAWFAPGLVGGGDAITQRTPGRHRDRCHVADYFSVSLRTRSGVLRGTERRADCSRPCWYWDPRAVFSSASSVTNGSPRWCRNPTALAIVGMAGVFHRGGTGAGYRHYSGHRDDGKLHLALADARMLLCGHGGADPAARSAHL